MGHLILHREICVVECWEDPDVFEAGGSLYWRGRAFRHVVSVTESRRIGVSKSDFRP